MATPPSANTPADDPYGLRPPTTKATIWGATLFFIIGTIIGDWPISVTVGRAKSNMQALCTGVSPQHCLHASIFGSIAFLFSAVVAWSLLLLLVYVSFYNGVFKERNKHILILRANQQYSAEERKAHEMAQGILSETKRRIRTLLFMIGLMVFIAFLTYNS